MIFEECSLQVDQVHMGSFYEAVRDAFIGQSLLLDGKYLACSKLVLHQPQLPAPINVFNSCILYPWRKAFAERSFTFLYLSEFGVVGFDGQRNPIRGKMRDKPLHKVRIMLFHARGNGPYFLILLARSNCTHVL